MSGGNLGERVGENVGVEDFAQWFPIIREAPHITPRRDPSGAGIVMSAPAVVPSLHGRFDPAGRLQHLGAGASTACVQETFQLMPEAR
jgi:hypothetical protein